MKFEYPSRLLEFILAGVIVEIPIVFIVGGRVLPTDLSSAVALLAVAYALGLGMNAIASRYFVKFVRPSSFKEYYEANRWILNGYEQEIEQCFGIDISDENFSDANKLVRRLLAYLDETSEVSRASLLYQSRLYRMSRTVCFASILWTVIALVVVICELLGYDYFTQFQTEIEIDFAGVLWILFFSAGLSIGLYLSAKDRIRYIAGIAIERFPIVYEKNKEKAQHRNNA